MQAAWERGLGHRGRSSVHHSGLPWCLCCSAAPTMVPCLPARAGTALGSAAAQGVLSYRNVFQEILSLVL